MCTDIKDNNGICARKIKWLKRSIPAMILTGITFLVVFLCYDIFYDINDDMMIESMLSGSYHVQYPFTYYLSVELGMIVSIFYNLIPGVAWLGVTFVSFYIISFFLMANKIYERLMEKKIVIRILAFVMLEAVFICMLLSNLVFIHYTVVAAVLGGAGLLLFALSKKPSEFAAPIVLFLLCYMVRANVFYMLLPFVGLVFLYLFLNNENINIKSYFISAGIFFVALLVIVIINTVIPLKYSEQWKAYKDFNDLRTTVYDYTGIADYEENHEFYEMKTDISKDDYDLYKSYDIAFMDKEKSVQDLEMIEQLHVQKNAGESVLGKIKWFTYAYAYRMIKEKIDQPYNIIVIILYAAAIGLAAVTKKYRNIAMVILIGLYRSALWIYLLYQGRYPERVTLSIYIMEALLLIAIIIRNVFDDFKDDKKSIISLIILVFIFAVPMFGRVDMLSQNYQSKINTNNTDDVVYSYMDEHPENIYLLDVYATVYYTKKALVKTANYENYLLLGGWPVEHPLYLEKVRSFGQDKLLDAFKENDNMYIVIREGEGANIDMMSSFTGCDLQVIEQLLSDDTVFYILGKK